MYTLQPQPHLQAGWLGQAGPRNIEGKKRCVGRSKLGSAEHTPKYRVHYLTRPQRAGRESKNLADLGRAGVSTE
jgi:hypothetical protein